VTQVHIDRIILAAIVLSTLGQAQEKVGNSDRARIYILQDEQHHQWCGYRIKTDFDQDVASVLARRVGGADYVDGRVSAVYLVTSTETGDWEIYDRYTLDNAERLQGLQRTISVIPENTREEQVITMKDGKIVSTHSTYRDLDTGKLVPKFSSWINRPPIFTTMKAFPFVDLIQSGRRGPWANNRICLPEH
jgi:hypothetical protein